MSIDGIQGNQRVNLPSNNSPQAQSVSGNGNKGSIFSGNKVKQFTREVNGVRQTIYVGKDQNGNKIRTDAYGNILITTSQFGKNTYITADKLQQQVIILQPEPENITAPAQEPVSDKPTPQGSEEVVTAPPVPDNSQEPTPPNSDLKPESNPTPEPAPNPTPEPAPNPDPKPAPNPTPKPAPKPAPRSLTPQERNTARHYGKNVSDYLVGYTDNSE